MSNIKRKKHTPETIEKIRQAKLKNPTRHWLGKKRSPKTIAKMSAGLKGKTAWNKGIPNPDIRGDNNPARRPEVRKILSEQKMGSNNPQFGKPAWNNGIKRWWKSQTEFKKGQTAGDKNHNWRGGITPATMRIRNSNKMRKWSKSILVRDNYTCQICGEVGGKLHADHIVPFGFILSQLKGENLYSESMDSNVLWKLDIGRALCVKCHKNTDTYLMKLKSVSDTIKAQWGEFLENL